MAWSFSFSASQLGALNSGALVLSAVQQGASQIVLDPTSVSLEVAAAVPEPATSLLMFLGAAPLVAVALRRRAAGSRA